VVTEERLNTLLAHANPVADVSKIDLIEVGAASYLATLEARSGEMSTKKIDVETPEPRRPRVRRGLLIGAVTVALIIIVGVALAFVTGDGTEVVGSDSRLLQLTFDGEQCTYEGPSELSAGEVEIVYHNESSEVIWFDFGRLNEGRTTQEIIDYTVDGVEPPSWWVRVWNQSRISANASSIPTMQTVAPGLHALVCGTWTPYQGYFGSELTVTP
jgi:hypothetical protein